MSNPANIIVRHSCERTQLNNMTTKIQPPTSKLQKTPTLRSLINVQSLITVQGVTLFYKKFKVSSGLGLFPFFRPQGFQKVQTQSSRNIFSGVGTAYRSLTIAYREDFFRKEISVHFTFIRDLRVVIQQHLSFNQDLEN